MGREQAGRVRITERREPSSPGGVPGSVAGRASGRRRRPSVPRRAQTRLTLKPGQKGTQQLVATYGARLVCVRYRYDPGRNKRFKTVEPIVGKRDWEPPRPRMADDQLVGTRIAFEEVEVRARVKQAGGTWDRPRRVWQLAYGAAVALGLRDRVVADPASTCGCPGSRRKHLLVDAAEASR